MECVCTCKDGSEKIIAWVGKNLGDEFWAFGYDLTERQRAEVELRASETRFRAIINASPIPMVLNDEQLRTTFLNSAFVQTLGYELADIPTLADWWPKAYPDPAYRQSVMEDWLAEMARAKRTGTAFLPQEVNVRCKDGTSRTVLASAAPLADSFAGTHLVILYDITERKRAEAVLRESEERFTKAFQRAPVWMAIADLADGTYLDVNESGLEASGFTRAEVIGHTAVELGWLAAADRAKLVRTIQEQGSVSGMELPSRTKDGRLLYGWVKAEQIMLAGRPCVISATVDITERKQAEEQLKLQFSALSAAANAIAITDRTGRIEWVNPSFTKLTGYTAAEAVGQNPRVLKSGQHPPAFYANLWACVLAGSVWHGELINKRKDGSLYSEEMTITPVRGADGAIAHFVAIKQDVTERRKLEEHMRQSQKMEAIGTLAGGIAHDFNNMLGALFSYAYLLQEDTAGIPAAQESIAEILKASSRAKELVQQILTFSRQREQNRLVIHLDTVVREAMKFLRASLPATIQMDLQLAADAPAVLADSTQIYQVAVNLTTNALHAMEGRTGKICVSLTAFQPDAALLQTNPDFHPVPYARLTITDTGHGMDAKTLERIFEPFFTTKPIGKGTGLGLAVVHGIVQSHDGIITVQSELGQGTTFSLYFPAQNSPAELATHPRTKLPQGRGEKILILDDEIPLTTAFNRMLKRMNYQITTCNSALEAVRLFQKNPAHFDLVLTDLTMPGLSGLEVAQQIHALRPEIPVVLMTGYSAGVNLENIHAAGICEIVEKPITPTALAKIIKRLLTKS